MYKYSDFISVINILIHINIILYKNILNLGLYNFYFLHILFFSVSSNLFQNLKILFFAFKVLSSLCFFLLSVFSHQTFLISGVLD